MLLDGSIFVQQALLHLIHVVELLSDDVLVFHVCRQQGVVLVVLFVKILQHLFFVLRYERGVLARFV